MWLYLCLFAFVCGGSMGAAQERPSEAEIGSIQVYLTPEQARAKIFPQARAFAREIKVVSLGLKAAIKKHLGRGFDGDTLEVYIAYGPDEGLLGYAILSEEIGKYRLITFMVGIGTDFRVREVAVLVYRESRGGEVRRSRFLRQYRKKSSADPVRINRDIINITGATLSVRALNFGVKKALLLTEALYRRKSGS